MPLHINTKIFQQFLIRNFNIQAAMTDCHSIGYKTCGEKNLCFVPPFQTLESPPKSSSLSLAHPPPPRPAPTKKLKQIRSKGYFMSNIKADYFIKLVLQQCSSNVIPMLHANFNEVSN